MKKIYFFKIFKRSLFMVVSRLLTCLDTLGGVGGPLRLEAVGVLRVTFLLVGTLVSGVSSFSHRRI